MENWMKSAGKVQVPVETWKGYVEDENGNERLLITRTAASADDKIDPTRVIKGVENTYDVISKELQTLMKILDDMAVDAEYAIVINSSMKINKYIEAFSDNIGELIGPMQDNLKPIPKNAWETRNTMQEKYNKDAYYAVVNSGATKWRKG